MITSFDPGHEIFTCSSIFPEIVQLLKTAFCFTWVKSNKLSCAECGSIRLFDMAVGFSGNKNPPIASPTPVPKAISAAVFLCFP